MHKADPWPLNPEGELFLGLKIENKRALANTEESLAVPGIAFAEWGPGDMGLSLGFVDRHDPPYPPEMQAARARVLAGCKANNVAFLNQTRPPDVVDMIAEGVRVGSGGQEAGRDRAPAHRAHHALVEVVFSPGGQSPPHPPHRSAVFTASPDDSSTPLRGTASPAPPRRAPAPCVPRTRAPAAPCSSGGASTRSRGGRGGFAPTQSRE